MRLLVLALAAFLAWVAWELLVKRDVAGDTASERAERP